MYHFFSGQNHFSVTISIHFNQISLFFTDDVFFDLLFEKSFNSNILLDDYRVATNMFFIPLSHSLAIKWINQDGQQFTELSTRFRMYCLFLRAHFNCTLLFFTSKQYMKEYFLLSLFKRIRKFFH